LKWPPSGGLEYPTHTQSLGHDSWFIKHYKEAAAVAGRSKLVNIR